MKFNLKRKIGSVVVALAMAVSTLAALPVMADHGIEVILTNVTTTGQAKIQVSVKGNVEDVTAMQAAFDFSGDLEYMGVEYLIDTDATADAMSSDNKITAGFALSEAIDLEGETPVFVLSFLGDEGDYADLTVDNAHSYCLTDAGTVYATGTSAERVYAPDSSKEPIDATVKIIMDKVSGFISTGDTGVTLKLIDQVSGNVFKSPLNSENRDNTTKAGFTITNTVVKGNPHTVELSGIGYKTYIAEDVIFNTKDDVLTITNREFVPGDVNKDGQVNDEDKAKYDEYISKGEYNIVADFNRDGYVDEEDNVFGSSSVQKTVPAKMTKPTVTGGEGKITVKWTKPDEEVTGYVIKYGKNSDNLTGTKEVNDADDTDVSISKLSDNTTYYVSVAAKNEIGLGEYSDISSAKTDKEENPNDNGGGFGTVPANPVTPAIPVTPVNPDEPFTDLTYYEWAKDSIYLLKDNRIINGVTDTQYAPQNNIRRADFILILTRMLSINDAFTENFADVAHDAYYYNAVGSAKKAGITTGNGTEFMPENSITRQDLITLAYRAFLSKGYIQETTDTSVLDEFKDKEDISDYAKVAMASMVKAGIIQGADGLVNPLGNATRAEVAVMCARLWRIIK
jgi:hypothetical protein